MHSPFDPIIYSHEVGVAKPDPRVYDLACRLLGLAPAEVGFLDDVPVNVEAALDAGLRAVLHVGTTASVAALNDLIADA